MTQSVRRHLAGKTILLTGGTGFLGKVIVERLLRAAPEIDHIYLLIRARRQHAAARFESEVLPSRAFAALARMHSDSWPRFVRARVTPIAGDVSQPRLGLADSMHAWLTSRVDFIINAAASVTFDAPLDAALRHNTRSVQHVADFARQCRAAALVQVSTAYVAGRRSGRTFEAPLTPDISSDEVETLDGIVHAVQADAHDHHWDARRTKQRLVDAGMTRARTLGWHDTYTYTKALGEMMLARHRGDVPTAIVRPSIIGSSIRDPEPGWLENRNVGDPLIIEMGRGRIADFPVRPASVIDIVPVDHVANAVVAVLPRVADMRRTIGYFTVGSGALNPLTGGQLYTLTADYFTRTPMRDRRGRPIVPSRWTFPTPADFRASLAGMKSPSVKRLLYLADLYESYTNISTVFDTTNARAVLDDLQEPDRQVLDFDVRRIDWRAYVQDVHLPGLRRHVLGEVIVQERTAGHG